LLRYLLSDKQYKELVGLPIVPLQSGGLGVFASSTTWGKKAIFLIGTQLERQLLAKFDSSFISDELPSDILETLAKPDVTQHLNIEILNPKGVAERLHSVRFKSNISILSKLPPPPPFEPNNSCLSATRQTPSYHSFAQSPVLDTAAAMVWNAFGAVEPFRLFSSFCRLDRSPVDLFTSKHWHRFPSIFQQMANSADHRRWPCLPWKFPLFLVGIRESRNSLW